MVILQNFEEFKSIFRVGKKWIRCAEAIENIENIKENVFYSIGDSLVYKISTINPKENNFTGNRRYMDVHYYISGEEKLEIGKKSDLCSITPYSDETDREYFQGNGEIINLKSGNLIIIENHEAHKFLGGENIKKVILRVTIEDNYFLNK